MVPPLTRKMTEKAALVNEPSGGAFQDATRKRAVETTWKPKQRSVRQLEERSEGEERRTASLIQRGVSRRWTGVKGCTSFTYHRNQLLDPERKPDQLYRFKFI